MGRPVASEENKKLGAAFAHAVRNPVRSSWLSRASQASDVLPKYRSCS